ncbi:MAG: SIMPL domain-containing protein [Myxococcota bacterium]
MREMTLPVLLSLFLPAVALAQQEAVVPPARTNVDEGRVVMVTGHGEASAMPDQAVISLGVESQAATAAAALAENNRKMTALLKALKDGGVESKDIQTTQFTIHPTYSDPMRGGEQRITGYRVVNMVTVTVKPVEKLGPLLDVVVKSGGNQVHGIQLGFSDPRSLVDAAREKAMLDARRKADQLARLAGVQRGSVVRIEEPDVGMPRPLVQGRMMAMEAAAAVPIEGGESTVTSTVHVVYALR